MTETNVQKRTIVVMDGSNEKIVGNIIELVDHITKGLFVKATCRILDSKHPTMPVIETTMDDERFEIAQRLLEIQHPGLCVFNPPM